MGPRDDVIRVAMDIRLSTPHGKPRALSYSAHKEFENNIKSADYVATRNCGSLPSNWEIYAIAESSPHMRNGKVLKSPLSRLLRLLELLLFAIKLCMKYDVLVSSQIPTMTVPIALAKRLVFWHRPVFVVREFILWSRNLGAPQTWFKKMAIKFIFKTLDLAICCSTEETRYYRRVLGWDEDKTAFIPVSSLRTNMKTTVEPKSRFVLAAGRTGRDYAVLARALEGTEIRAVLVCSPGNLKGTEIPDNIEVRYDIKRAVYEDLIGSCAVAVVPLTDSLCSAGQRVLEAAMSCGKAVVATRTTGTEDYITHDETGLLVKPGDAIEMRNAIVGLLDDAALADRLGRNAKAYAHEHFSPEVYAERLIAHIAKLLRPDGRHSDSA